MNSVGERLRLERQNQGLSLSQVAEQTRISSRYLVAIESGDLSSLPGEFFYRSFVRQYASMLGMEPSEFDADLQRIFPPQPGPEFPIGVPNQRGYSIPRLDSGFGKRDRMWPASVAILVLVLIVCSGLYALWQRSRTTSTTVSAQQPPATISAAPNKAEAPAAQPLPLPAPVTETPPPVQPAAPSNPPAPMPPTQPAPEPAPSPASQAAESKVPPPSGPADVKVVLDVLATADTWFSAKEGEKTLFSGVLKAGQTKTFRGSDAVRLLIGNAGGLDVKWNGQPVGEIGPAGQVRVLAATAEGTRIFDPKPKTP